jgi:hypothetical protein
MTRPVKFLIGLVAALLMGWLWHGPGGQGAALIDGLEQQTKTAVAMAKLPGSSVRLEREPLRRAAVISGTADNIQREGLGSGWGVKDYARAIEGLNEVRWDDEPGPGGLPLLAETLILVAIAYLIGFGLGWLLFGRRRRESFLD